MRLHPFDVLLFSTVKILKFFDKRETDLTYFNPGDIRNILVVASTAIGDTLLSTPAIRAVRERYPQANIAAHFNKKNMELFENNPHINEIIPYFGGYRKFFHTVREFRRRKFDLALIFHGNEPQATPMAYLSGARFILKVPIPEKYAFLLSNNENGFDNPWNHHAIDVKLKTASFAHCKEDNRRMVLYVDEDDRRCIEKFLEKTGVQKNDIIILFQVGAAAPYKAWPEECFIELGKRLSSYDEGIWIIVTGSREEQHSCDSVAKGIGGRTLSVAGKFSLKRLKALIKAAGILVTNDTGPMHMAVAMHTNTVSLFCPTNHWGVGPVQNMNLHKIIFKDKPCDPCVTKKCKSPHCMESITVDEVYGAVRELLDENSPV